MLLTACASTASTPVEAESVSGVSRVQFDGSSGLLACAWNDADAVFAQAMSQLGPALTRCADDEGTTQARWTLWVDVDPGGEVERAWVPSPGQVAASDADARPPACATEALEGLQLASGPPSCGSVLMLGFVVGD